MPGDARQHRPPPRRRRAARSATPITTAVPRQRTTIEQASSPANASRDAGVRDARAGSCPRARGTDGGRPPTTSLRGPSRRPARRSASPEPRPPLRNVSSSAIIGMPHASSSRSPNSAIGGESNWANTGSTSSPKPVATISGPLRLSGRRRQAISPQATNAPPTRRNTIAVARDRLARRRRSTTSTTSSAATVDRPQRDPERGAPRRAREAPQARRCSGCRARPSRRRSPASTARPYSRRALRPRRRRSAAARSRPGRRPRRRASRPWRSCSRRRRRRRSACRCWPTPTRRSSRPARSHRRWNVGPRDLLAAARVGDRAGDDDGLAGQRRVGGDLAAAGPRRARRGRRPSSRSRASSARAPSRLRCACRLAATFGPMSSTCCERLLVGVGDLLERCDSPARHSRAAVRLGGHRDRQADQRAAQADAAAAVDRLDHAVGRHVADAARTRAAARASARRSPTGARAARPR